MGLSAPSAPKYEYLLTGDSCNFAASLGNWVNSGGTLTRDTTAAYKLSGLAASAKYVTTATSDYAEVAVPGTFKAGKRYDGLVYLKCEAGTYPADQINLILGLQGTDDTGTAGVYTIGTSSKFVGASGQHAPVVVSWTPSANRTGVKLRFKRHAGTASIACHIAYAQVLPVETGQEIGLRALVEPGDSTKSHWHSQYLTDGPGGAGLFWGSYLTVNSRDSKVSLDLKDDGTAVVTASHAAGSDLADEGLDIEVGPDFVGLYISERSASTVQLYADVEDYMLQLRHRGTGGWSASDDGTVNARIDSFFEWVFQVAGTLTTGTNKSSYFRAGYKCRVDEVQCHVATAPTGQALIVDVNDDGTTVFTTQANRPSIADGANDDTSGVADGGTAIAKDSVIAIDIDQVGSGVAGADLTVHVRGRYIW
jgi:hypothetical protein